jgi:ABC-type sugar transport system permease subunit
MGLVNYFLGWFRGDAEPIFWLSTKPYALVAIISVRIWRAFGYYMVIYLAGLQNISSIYYDQAAIDGVNWWQRFRYITSPLLSPTTLVVSLMCVTYGFQAFAVPQIMTGGGPGNSTKILPILLYEMGFRWFKMGQASAISVVIFVIVATFAVAQSMLARNITVEG